VTKFGFYVSIDVFGAEGIVPLDGIDTDRYHLSDDGSFLVGSKTGKTFSVGDRVRVQAVDASLSRRRITFRWMKTTKRVSASGIRRAERGGNNRKSGDGKTRRRR
jgi:ribonuclease R